MDGAGRTTPIPFDDFIAPPYSMLRSEIEAETLPYCQKNNIDVIVYSPMQSGLLTGAWTKERHEALPANDWRREKKRAISGTVVLAEPAPGRSAGRHRRQARQVTGRSGLCLDVAAAIRHRCDRGSQKTRTTQPINRCRLMAVVSRRNE